MHITKFKIESYRGIKECEIVLNTNNPRLFPLIGLNESGKTTILEAISSLRIIPKNNAPDNESGYRTHDEHRHVSKIAGESNKDKSTIRIFYRVTPSEFKEFYTHPNKPEYDPEEENKDKLETRKATLEDIDNTADHNLIFERILHYGEHRTSEQEIHLYDAGENNPIDTKKKESKIPPTPFKMDRDITDAHDRHWDSSIFYFSQFNFKFPKQIVAGFGHMPNEPFLRYLFEYEAPSDKGYGGYLLDILSEIQPEIFEIKATIHTNYNDSISKIKVTPSFSSEKSISEKFKHYKTLKKMLN